MTRVDDTLHGLQVLRGLAALCVLVFHVYSYTDSLYRPGQPWVAWIPGVLAQGVYLFFEISGYLMAWLLDAQKHRHFLLRRILRIYPAYVLAVAFALTAHLSIQGRYSAGWAECLKSLTLLPVERGMGILRIEWTLVYEVFFYLVCTVFAGSNRRRFYPWFLLAWGAAILAFPDASAALHPRFPGITFSTRNLYFIFGGLTYYAGAWWTDGTAGRVSSRAWAWLAALSLASFLGLFHALGSARGVTVGLNAVILSHSVVYGASLALFLFAVVRLQFEPPAFLVRLGDYSYGIYLVHATVLYLSLKALAAGGAQSGMPAVLLVFAGALFAGWQFGRLDVTLQSWLKRKNVSWSPAWRLGVAAVALLVIGLDIRERGTLELRRAGVRLGVIAPVVPSQFDSRRVLPESESWGWFDWARIETNDTLVMGGWAVDRVQRRPPESIILVAGTRTWPISVRWQARPDAAQTSGLDPGAQLGWVATIDGRKLPAGRHELKFYVPTPDGHFVAIRSKTARVVEVSQAHLIQIAAENAAPAPVAKKAR